MNLVQALKNLGLNEKEAQVYIALLQMGQSTAYTVAKHSGLKKPTAYVILDGLIERGVVFMVPKTNTREYSAVSPEELFGIVKSRLESAEKEALPELMALNKGQDHKVSVTYYEGLDGIKEMYNRLNKEMIGKKFIGFYAHQKDTPKIVQDYWLELTEEFRKRKIARRGITTADPSITSYLTDEFAKRHLANLKALDPAKYSSNISIEIYKNKTQIISHRYLQGILIDNPDIASVMKQIFELVWDDETKLETSSLKEE
jgi:HTH-type transcriptional regulator, sugar sensing transcriptional regulator